MSKSVYQEYNEDALKHFGLEHATEYGVCSNSNGDIETIIAVDSQTKYETIRDIIKTGTTKQLKTSWKRVFLLPKSPVSIDRVRSALKEHGITLVSDLNAAEAVITHDDFHDHFKSGNNINSTTMLAKIWNYETFKESNSMPSSINYSKATMLNGKSNPILYDDKVTNWFNLWSSSVDTYDTLYDAWMLTGMAVNLAHKIDTESLPVMDVEDVMHQSATKQILDEQLVKDIITQVNSYNDEDNAIAGKILPTIDYESNYHLLWTLANGIDNAMYKFNRNKDVQYWITNANIKSLSYRTAEEMILWLDEKELLDEENFRYLEPIVRREIRIENRSLYVFKIQVKPEYRQYLKPKKK